MTSSIFCSQYFSSCQCSEKGRFSYGFAGCAVKRASMDDSETRVDDVHELGFKRTLSIVQVFHINNRFEGSQTLPNRETENCRSCRLCEGRGVLLVFVLFLEHLVINLQSRSCCHGQANRGS
ncbi:hypothetical protein ACQJBY_053544 [Aegilops geniculata]